MFFYISPGLVQVGVGSELEWLMQNPDFTHLPTVKRIFFKVTVAAQ
jgi:hypothetical protein